MGQRSDDDKTYNIAKMIKNTLENVEKESPNCFDVSEPPDQIQIIIRFGKETKILNLNISKSTTTSEFPPGVKRCDIIQ